jgi:hypothetical protein
LIGGLSELTPTFVAGRGNPELMVFSVYLPISNVIKGYENHDAYCENGIWSMDDFSGNGDSARV